MAKRIVRTPEAAQYLGLSPSTLEKLRVVGDGPRFIRLGVRAIGYDLAELDNWIEGRVASNTCKVHGKAVD